MGFNTRRRNDNSNAETRTTEATKLEEPNALAPAHQPNHHDALKLRASTFGVGVSRLIALGVGQRSNAHLPFRSGGVRCEEHHLRLAEIMPGFANATRLCGLF